MDVCISLKRPGYRISRKKNPDKIGKAHRITPEESVDYFKTNFGVEVT